MAGRVARCSAAGSCYRHFVSGIEPVATGPSAAAEGIEAAVLEAWSPGHIAESDVLYIVDFEPVEPELEAVESLQAGYIEARPEATGLGTAEAAAARYTVVARIADSDPTQAEVEAEAVVGALAQEEQEEAGFAFAEEQAEEAGSAFAEAVLGSPAVLWQPGSPNASSRSCLACPRGYH
jgi:hypothetical protein